ncbi:MAG: DUF4163 domain-containing protein [Eubacteriaceae bacterium]|nr:DUF4163 domain-containing protein [Eubacteriaceae bacterium]
MLKSNKIRKTFFVLAVTVVLAASSVTFNGCTPETDDNTDIGSKKIDSPIKINYLLRNPIKANFTSIPENEGFTQNYFAIEGLKDKALESSINQKLTDLYEQVVEGELPAYRGIKKRVPEGSTIASGYLDAALPYNYSNVLSVLVTGYKYFDLPENKGQEYVGITETINIDLNTGKEITLKDVFTDDADYKALLNDYLAELILRSNAGEEDYYSMALGGAKMAAPFKGIEDQQKFFLFQGGIGLVFDDETPEFDTGLNSAVIYIYFEELGDCVAITKRYVHESADLYTKREPAVKEFSLPWSGNDIIRKESKKVDRVNIALSTRYPEKIHDKVKIKIAEMELIDQEILSSLNGSAAEDIFIEQNIWAYLFGEYTVVYQYTGTYQDQKFQGYNAYHTYDSKGNELALKDLFHEGFAYEPIIKRNLTEMLNQNPETQGLNPNDLYDKLEFSISQSELMFITQPIRFDENRTYPVAFTVEYEQIGCDNLTIFD